MRFTIGPEQFEAQFQQEEVLHSKHTGVPLRRGQLWLSATSRRVHERILELLQTAQREGLTSQY